MRNAPARTLAVLAVAFTVCVLSTGCGASALEAHARTALVLRSTNDAAVVAIEGGCERQAVAAASDTSVDHDTAAANAAAVLGRCERAVNIQHAFASALNAYIDQLLAVVNSGDEGPSALDRLKALAVNLIPLYADLADVADDLGLNLPHLPAALSGLTEPD